MQNHKLASLALTLTLPLAAGGMIASADSHAADRPFIAVGTAKTRKTVIAFAEIQTGGDKSLAAAAKQISDTVSNDLAFMDLFNFLSPSAFVEKAGAGITLDRFKLSDWTSVGAEIVIKSALTRNNGNLALEAYVYDAAGNKIVLAKRYAASAGDTKTLAHTFANNIVESLTGMPGIFLTKIAMSCDRTGKKEIYMMNFDGTEAKQLTQHHSIAFSPAWSPDGSKLAYSVYARHKNNEKNIDLYEFNFATSTYRMLSNRKGLNSGAAYSPDGSKIAMTMSFLGNPDIFTLEPGAGSVTRITKSLGTDVDPTWSPDGKQIAFTSSRAGAPMIFTMNADGSNARRLTFAGKYNATPSWSPANNKIAFASWLEKHFDVFMMNPDGTNLQRLTKDQGNNEDPTFSPDGNFLAFSSNRTGQQNIYVMNVDGTFVKRLTFGMGNCVAPKWSMPPK